MGVGRVTLPAQDVRRAVRTGAIVTIVSVLLTFLPVWVWLQIDPVIRLADIYISCVVIPALVAPACSFFVLRAQIRTERLAKENDRLANHDELTGLPNRRAFFARATAAAAEPAASTSIFACAIADIDNFKTVNDTLGHDTGDRVLKAVARALEGLAPPGITAARLGGEEFALAGRFDSEAAAAIWFDGVVKDLALRRHVNGMRVTVSLGWCVARPGEPLSSQLSRADHALYDAKAAGKNRSLRARDAAAGRLAAAS